MTGVLNKLSIAKCESLISYPFVRLTYDERTFEEFANDCSRTIGGHPEEWMKKNKKVLGFFGKKDKTLRKNTRFQVPDSLVLQASDAFFETVGLRKIHSQGSSPGSQESPGGVQSPCEIV